LDDEANRYRLARSHRRARGSRCNKDLRPKPGQMLWAGREASVTGYRHGPDDRPLYALKGAPGLWLEEWIDPI
jgi:hypothetical protein